MKEVRRLLAKNPEIALGVAAFAGLALGAGWIPIPSVGSLLPSMPSKTPAAPAASSSPSATTQPPASSAWD